MQFRIGQGWDIHQLVPNRKLILAGVNIEHHLGLLGHSDADVVMHALTDALLGAMAKGDIGRYFSDQDNQFKNQASAYFLQQCFTWLQQDQWLISNIDCTIIAQKPKLAPHIATMQLNIANLLQLDINQVNLKAKTAEKLGPVGNEQAIEASAIVLIYKL